MANSNFLELCWGTVYEYSFALSQELDPRSESRGVLQFKTGLLSVIKVSLSVSVCTVRCYQFGTPELGVDVGL